MATPSKAMNLPPTTSSAYALLMLRRAPSLESLRIFEACARHQNFTRAASELNITPAAVSLRIRDLEADLGQPLFARNGPRISTTEAGERFACRLALSLTEIRLAVEDFYRDQKTVRISAVPTLAATWLPQALAAYELSFGGLPIEVESTSDIAGAGSFDLAVRHGHGDWTGLEALKIFGGAVLPVIPAERAGDVRCPDDLCQLPLVPDPRWSAWFRLAGARPRQLQFTTNFPSQDLGIRSAIASGAAVLASTDVLDWAAYEGEVVCPFAISFDDGRAYFLAHKAGESRPGVLALRDYLVHTALDRRAKARRFMERRRRAETIATTPQ